MKTSGKLLGLVAILAVAGGSGPGHELWQAAATSWRGARHRSWRRFGRDIGSAGDLCGTRRSG